LNVGQLKKKIIFSLNFYEIKYSNVK